MTARGRTRRVSGGEEEEEEEMGFARRLAGHKEDVVLETEEGMYGSQKLPWVKLKEGYVPQYGGASDLVPLGAEWDADRGKKTFVAPTVHTMFLHRRTWYR